MITTIKFTNTSITSYNYFFCVCVMSTLRLTLLVMMKNTVQY